MGLALGVASLALGVISGVNQMSAAKKYEEASKKASAQEKIAAEEKKKANEVELAKSKISSVEDRRQRIREERIRRNMILQASENMGASGSSGETGSIAALGANFANLVSGSRSVNAGNTAINSYNQKAIDASVNSRTIMAEAGAASARADAFSSFLNIFSTGLRGLQ